MNKPIPAHDSMKARTGMIIIDQAGGSSLRRSFNSSNLFFN